NRGVPKRVTAPGGRGSMGALPRSATTAGFSPSAGVVRAAVDFGSLGRRTATTMPAPVQKASSTDATAQRDTEPETTPSRRSAATDGDDAPDRRTAIAVRAVASAVPAAS